MSDHNPGLCAEFQSRVATERKRQLAKWGLQRHSIERWVLILAEEFGEVAQSANEAVFRDPSRIWHVLDELVHVAAVAEGMYSDLRETKAPTDTLIGVDPAQPGADESVEFVLPIHVRIGGGRG